MAENSTNVRTKMALMGVRATAKGLGAVAPGLAAAWAERLFLTPQRTRRSRTAEAVLAQGQQRVLKLGGEKVAVWSWGEGPRVLLVHGWSGYGGQLTAFVAPLVEAGFSVVTYDAPGHGVSSGRTSSLPEMADMVARVGRATGGPYAVVAHSFGAAATAVALRDGMRMERAVFISPPSDPRWGVKAFGKTVGLSEDVQRRMAARIEARFDMRLRDLALPHFAPLLQVPLRIFHDVGDREVPLEAGEAVARAWPGAKLTRTEGLGHHRILYAPEVVTPAVSFLAEGRPSNAWPAPELLASASAAAPRGYLRMVHGG
ncbi:alpha/beta hydrolase [Pyxidicoccus caerfyrddinensis]|uniref:alpha/beta hydrolase n=1 Tax=Pyxidicoccus caerfyrddinensis TaxID=2709663 RepID=UPI0013DD21D2|nr:alpha/beta fold hydrolase [Pyxidicoccus caerfyrddinensis]